MLYKSELNKGIFVSYFPLLWIVCVTSLNFETQQQAFVNDPCKAVINDRSFPDLRNQQML